MAVRVIRARNTDPVVTMPTQVTKAAAYCRISTDSIDALYEKAMQAGALGGKLLGAGG